MATKEFLRKMRQKYHLGEYSKKSITKSYNFDKPKRIRKARRIKHKRRRTGGFSMARRRSKRTHHKRGFMGGGVGSIAKSALIGVGTAHFAGYIPVNVPMKEEAAGAAGAYLFGGKSIKSAAVGAAAVYLAKMLNGQSGVSGSQNNAYGF